MSAREVRTQFRREKIGIAAGNQKPQPLPLESIYKQLPAGKILDFVEQKITGIAVMEV
jgi:hypothetical protein